ncbi:MAG: TetR/AcrR family transcriptional regulator [Pseudomonadota bacterium]
MVTNSAASPRPDRRRARTRAALLRAGQALFAERSVEGVSIDDIVAAADVAKGSFYNHFPDKDALARELADLARTSVEAVVAHVTRGVDDPAERVARAICAFARQAAENPVGAGAMLRLFHGAGIPDHAMNRGVRADVQAGLAAGRFSGLALESAVLLAVGVAQIATARSLEHADPRRAEALAGDLVFGLLRGLGLETTSARAVADEAAAAIFDGPSLLD